MTNLDKMPPLKNIQPSIMTYNAVLDCWAKSGRNDAADGAENLLREMEAAEGLYPDTISCNTVIHIFAESAEGVERAEDLLRRMHNGYKRGGRMPNPDHDSYSILLQAFSSHAEKIDFAGRKAERWLQRMIESGSQQFLKLAHRYQVER